MSTERPIGRRRVRVARDGEVDAPTDRVSLDYRLPVDLDRHRYVDINVASHRRKEGTRRPVKGEGQANDSEMSASDRALCTQPPVRLLIYTHTFIEYGRQKAERKSNNTFNS